MEEYQNLIEKVEEKLFTRGERQTGLQKSLLIT
jgi:hypothetical protein